MNRHWAPSLLWAWRVVVLYVRSVDRRSDLVVSRATGATISLCSPRILLEEKIVHLETVADDSAGFDGLEATPAAAHGDLGGL
jgi:hypothetical protein